MVRSARKANHDWPYLSFKTAKNLNEWLGVLVTELYCYFTVYHGEKAECRKWSLTDQIGHLIMGFNFDFRDESSIRLFPFHKRLWRFLGRIPPLSIWKEFTYQIRWRIERVKLGHGWRIRR